MANATAIENCFLDHSYDAFNIDELSKLDSSLLMSLLEEDSQVEDGGDEMLRRMFQPLEHENANQNSCSETYNSDSSSEDYRFSDVDQLENCSMSPDHCLDFEWIDMEMAYSCPNDDIISYCTGHFTEKIQTMVELGILDYSQVCCGMPVEEDDYIDLWQ